jgi:hypothetical protein
MPVETAEKPAARTYPKVYVCVSRFHELTIEEGYPEVRDPATHRVTQRRQSAKKVVFKDWMCKVESEARRLRMSVPDLCAKIESTDAFKRTPLPGRGPVTEIFDPDKHKGRKMPWIDEMAPPPRRPDVAMDRLSRELGLPVRNVGSPADQPPRKARGDSM